MQAQSSGDVAAEAAALSSLDWVLDGSGVAVMDSCGRLALLDIHGVAYSIQSAARPGCQPGQLAQARPLLAPAGQEVYWLGAYDHQYVQTPGSIQHLYAALQWRCKSRAFWESWFPPA